MKRTVIILSAAILLYFLYASYLKVLPSHFITIEKRELTFSQFFAEELSEGDYNKLASPDKLTLIYERLKKFICIPDCEISVFSFDTAPVDFSIEKLFTRTNDVSMDAIMQLRKKLASEQYYFSKLMNTVVFINDTTLRNKVVDSHLPWIGRTVDSILVEFVYAANLNEWLRPWILRFIRDYRKVAKIYIFPYESGEDFQLQYKTIVCLKEKRSFWELYFADKLDLVHVPCATATNLEPMEAKDLSIRLGAMQILNPDSYYQVAKSFQISYLALKVR